MLGSGTLSTRTSSMPARTTAFMWPPWATRRIALHRYGWTASKFLGAPASCRPTVAGWKPALPGHGIAIRRLGAYTLYTVYNSSAPPLYGAIAPIVAE